ncbi:Trehalase [Bryocella elongata]|uniref:Trehalase n=2 Tax=Bryocella elongata TaxID=863522 RepID=A0A1H6ACL6_9BACT|nr:Trehalase [Bryocella elongata]
MLQLSALTGAAATLPPAAYAIAGDRADTTRASAIAVLLGNVRKLPQYDVPMLVEGAVYPGVWMECGPLEALVYAKLGRIIPSTAGPTPLQVARANHMAFFKVQHEDGQIPSSIKLSGEVGFGQIQMVVPIAATAWELAKMSKDEELLTTAYAACARWDAFLLRYRNTRGTGLTEGFCTYDSGMDNSPRWAGIPNRCPDNDARKSPPIASMPRLCPDLSATTYGARIALAAMARELGKMDDAARWEESAEHIRTLILDKLWSEEDACFFDLDAQGKFVKVRSIVNARVLSEHVLKLEHPRDRSIFQALWTRQLGNPEAFWTKFPFPSSALNEPTFVRPIPRNSWGGASQALTALRTSRWMAHYGKQKEHVTLMRAWVEAIERSGGFRQQMDPLTGDFTMIDPSGYSPAALVYLDFVRQLNSHTNG